MKTHFLEMAGHAIWNEKWTSNFPMGNNECVLRVPKSFYEDILK